MDYTVREEISMKYYGFGEFIGIMTDTKAGFLLVVGVLIVNMVIVGGILFARIQCMN